MIQRREVRQRVVSERSPLLGAALLLAPTLCLVALRFASTALEEVISEDTVLMYSLHGATLIAGLIMFLRYRKVEDHEYHRSKAIRKLSRTYSREDRGLWEKGDSAIESLESKAKSPKKGRSAIREMALKKGSIGSLNQEMKEEEILEEGEVEPQIQGISTIVDEQAITNPIWVTVGGQPPRSLESAQYSIRWIDRLREMAEAWPGWRSQTERDHVFEQFDEARAVFESFAATAGSSSMP